MEKNKNSHIETENDRENAVEPTSEESQIGSSFSELVVSEKEKAPMLHGTTEERFHEQEMTVKIAELESGAQYIVGGETNISDEVIATIAATAAREVEGVDNVGTSSLRRTIAETFGGSQKKARGAEVEQGKREVLIDLTIQVVYGFSIPQIVIDVRKRVAAHLLELAGLIAKEINVNITKAEFPDKMPGRVK